MSWPARVVEEVAPFFATLALSPDPVFVTDRQNCIAFWNRKLQEILGYASEEVVGLSCAEVLQGCDVHGNRYCSRGCPVAQMAIRSESVRRFALQVRAKDGYSTAVDISILTLVLGQPGGFFLVHLLKPSDTVGLPSRDPSEPAALPRDPMQVVRESPDARARKLTAREVEILAMLAAGRPTPEIAARLGISNLTVRNHVQNILDKLEVHSKAEAVAFAFQKRLF